MGYGDIREIILNPICPITYVIKDYLQLTYNSSRYNNVGIYVIFYIKNISLARNSFRFKGLPDFLPATLATNISLQPIALKSERTALKKT